VIFYLVQFTKIRVYVVIVYISKFIHTRLTVVRNRVARLAIPWPISTNLAIFNCAGHEKTHLAILRNLAFFGHFFGLSL